MLDVSEATKALLKTDSVYKEMYVTIQNTGSPYIFENEDIYYEAFELKESILDGSDMTFMGCIASEMRITIRNRDNLKDYALNNRKITVEMTPYDRENTKNHLQSLYSAGDELEFNNVKMVVGDDLSLALTRSANADTVINVCDFMVDEDATWLLSGCPNGSAITNKLYGRLTVTNPTTGIETVYNDMGSDVTIAVSRGNIIQYDIIIASGQSTGVTFYPMLRDVGETSTYEPYGNKYIEMDTIPLFTGYIDNGEYDKDKSWLKLTAYDVLSKLNTFNVWNWYNKVAFKKNGDEDHDVDSKGQIGLDKLLERFADYVNTNSGYEFSLSERCPVILSDVKIKKRLKNKEMTATNFLKSFCQLACACGSINREGEFQLIYRNAETTELDVIPYYRSLTAKDYVVQPFANGITIITNSDDNGVTLTAPTTITVDWDDDTNDNYVIDDDDELLDLGDYYISTNGIVKKLSKNKRKAIINILLNNVQTDYYTFKSYNLECNGLPYIECGDDIICAGSPETEVHTNEPFTSGNQGTLNVANSGGIETSIIITATFETYSAPMVYSNTFIGVSCGSMTSAPPYLGVDLPAVMAIVGKTIPAVGDKISFYKYDGTTRIIYSSLVDEQEYDISNCIYIYGGYTWNSDMYIIENKASQIFTGNSNGPFTMSYTADFTLYKNAEKFQSPIVNRTLKGIQSMIDTFSFELPDTLKKYGGTTDKKKDSNIEKDDSISNLIAVSFTENGNYSPYDYDAMGFSSVEVNVSGGGTAKRYEYVWTPLDITIGTYVPDFATFTSHNAVVYKGRIHLFGQNTTATTLHVSWSDEDGYREESTLPFSTYRSVFVADNNYIHLLGGVSGTGSADYSRVHYIWDGNSWQDAFAIIGSSLPMGLNTVSIPRYTISYDDADHKLYVVGGANATLGGSVNVIDLDDHSLVSYPFVWTSPDSYMHTNACWYGSSLYIVGFRTYDNLMACYKMDSNGGYTQLNDTPWNYNEKGGALFEYDGALHYIGGGSTVPCGIRRYNASLDKWLDVGIYPYFQTTQFEDAPYSRPPLVIAPPKSSGLNAVKYNNVIHVIGLASTTGIGYAGHWKVEEVEV